MPNLFSNLSDTDSWAVLNAAVRRAAAESGYRMERRPGRGRSNVWEFDGQGNQFVASVRTTRNRWFAFPPRDKGTKWKTLDDVEKVIVAGVDDPDDPKNVEVYLFGADEVRKRFSAAYEARTKAGMAIKDEFGMWVRLDEDHRRLPVSVGSGLSEIEDALMASYSIEELLFETARTEQSENIEMEVDAAPSPNTIAEVMTWARDRIAEISGTKPEAIKFDLRIEY